MSNYCDFNPRLFRSFTSMKKKIVPTMADDWEIVPNAYNIREGFSLKSEKANQQVADIVLRRFLRFCGEQNLTIKGLKLQGNFVIGNDRSVYTEEMYNTWKEKFDERTSTIIDVKDYKVGHAYKTPCGKTLVYLGSRYVKKMRPLVKDNGPNRGKLDLRISKVNLKHYAISEDQFLKATVLAAVDDTLPENSYDYRSTHLEPFFSTSELTNKFAKDLGKAGSKERADAILDRLKYDSNVIYFEKERPLKTAKLSLKKVSLEKGAMMGETLILPEEVLIGLQRGWSGDRYIVYYHGISELTQHQPDTKKWLGKGFNSFILDSNLKNLEDLEKPMLRYYDKDRKLNYHSSSLHRFTNYTLIVDEVYRICLK